MERINRKNESNFKSFVVTSITVPLVLSLVAPLHVALRLWSSSVLASQWVPMPVRVTCVLGQASNLPLFILTEKRKEHKSESGLFRYCWRADGCVSCLALWRSPSGDSSGVSARSDALNLR
ncbi:hypothetical protein E2C01_090398 [Portunus trituberculatus]|uniref:Uncharacterized protein n=1 Tax=Portunus trituberculatus TaxID=210409 RepID=A0A5B7JK56_PORTR|nr:hypothetical protein [Portunus trituberculatus]